MYKKLELEIYAILSSVLLNSHCDAVEETFLKMAGITTQPTRCQFGQGDNNCFRFRITGISGEEANKFTAYLQTKSDTPVTQILDGSTYIFQIPIKAMFNFLADFHINLLEIEKTNAPLINHYRQECKIFEVGTKDLVKYGKSLSIIYDIIGSVGAHVSNSDVLEETFLQLAGIDILSTPPKSCSYRNVGDVRMELELGISQEQARKLCAFFNAQYPNSAIILEQTTSQADESVFVINVKSTTIFKSSLLFKKQIENNNPVITDKYREKNGIKFTKTAFLEALTNNHSQLIGELFKQIKLFNETQEDIIKLKSLLSSGFSLDKENNLLQKSCELYDAQINTFIVDDKYSIHTFTVTDNKLQYCEAILKLANQINELKTAIELDKPQAQTDEMLNKLRRNKYMLNASLDSTNRKHFKDTFINFKELFRTADLYFKGKQDPEVFSREMRTYNDHLSIYLNPFENQDFPEGDHRPRARC